FAAYHNANNPLYPTNSDMSFREVKHIYLTNQPLNLLVELYGHYRYFRTISVSLSGDQQPLHQLDSIDAPTLFSRLLSLCTKIYYVLYKGLVSIALQLYLIWYF